MSAPRPMARTSLPADRDAVGLALALAAFGVHALFALAWAGAGAQTPDTLARVIAFVLLPGWAAVRWLPGKRRGRFETAALVVGLGGGLAGVTGWVARALALPADAAALVLFVLALVSLAPRPATAPAGPVPEAGSLAAGLGGALLGGLGLALATSAWFATWVRPLSELLAPAADTGARAAGVLCALLLALSSAALVRRWTHSAAVAGAVAILLAAGAASMVFTSKARPSERPAPSAPALDARTKP